MAKVNSKLASAALTPSDAPARAVKSVKELLGDHPEDVISPIESAAEALGWLEEIFITIRKEALDERQSYRIKRLAEAGAYLASDLGNYVGHRHEIYIERLQTAGILASPPHAQAN